MGAFLAVAQGSPQPPKLICLEYRGHNNKSKQQPIVLIGKGITFDTGGNSLKSASSMVGMKYDMSGAASVLGLMNFAIEMKLNINIVGIMAVTEKYAWRRCMQTGRCSNYYVWLNCRNFKYRCRRQIDSM